MPRQVVDALRRRNHDVAWAAEVVRGAPDDELLARAVAERRVVVSLDKTLATHLPAGLSGIVIVRLRGAGPSILAALVVSALESRNDWKGHLSVIEPAGIRMRKLRARRSARRYR